VNDDGNEQGEKSRETGDKEEGKLRGGRTIAFDGNGGRWRKKKKRKGKATGNAIGKATKSFDQNGE